MKIQFPILIVGLGKSGQSIKRLLSHLYPKHTDEIKAYDDKSSDADFIGHQTPLEKVLETYKPATLVVSPGVPLQTPGLKNWTGLLTSELDLAYQCLTDEKVISVTGSMGKSTTVSLLGEAVHALSKDNFVGGNLGFPLADYIFELQTGLRGKAKWVVLELSSYQLENFKSLNSHTSVLTALSPNHLERYPDLEAYYSTKWTLLGKTQGSFFINFDNAEVLRWCSSKLTQQITCVYSRDFTAHKMSMVGSHNRENLSLALAVAKSLSFPATAISAIENYKGLPHRLELVSETKGVRYINDSKATTIESVLAAVKSCLPDVKNGSRLVVLIGGKDKNLPWENLKELAHDKKLNFIFFGECAELAQVKSALSGPQFSSLKQAFIHAQSQTEDGDTVLLSPGGSSLDEFKNFEQRGDFFRSLI